MQTIEQLEQMLTEPSDDLIADIARINGDIMILGVGGKMGPTLARMAKNAIDKAGIEKRVMAVSRFSSGTLREELESYGIETISADLLDDSQLNSLPEVENIIFLAGHKFGTVGNEHYTWAMNTFMPGKVAEKFRKSRIVSFSTGNVYPLTPVSLNGATEDHPTGPIGEYAQSCLGRERIFNYYSYKYEIPMVHFRLNYANDLRYGVLLEIAKSVKEQKPIDLSMGHANVIWQGDANEMAIRSLLHCDSPPNVINITGPETVSIRWLGEYFGKKFGVEPVFVNKEQDTALLSNASKSHKLFGYPKVSLRKLIDWTAEWIENDGQTINKPTHFQERKGGF
jgi:nucleoside-diphosphate-sugar epimerase